MKLEEICQKELNHYKDFHTSLVALGKNGSSLSEGNSADYFKDRNFKDTMETLVADMMKSESGDELLANHRTFQTLLGTEVKKGRMSNEDLNSLLKPVEEMCSSRSHYLPKPFKKASHAKGAAWIGLGTAVITTALVLTVVGAPLAPVAALGGATLAYGLADNAKDLAESFDEKSKESLIKMHQGKIDDFKLSSDEKIPESKVKDYLAAKPQETKAAKPEKKSKKSLLKKWGKRLAYAGLALAVVGMVAVFPPVGIPAAAGIAIAGVATGVICVTGAAYAKEYFEGKKEHNALYESKDRLTKDKIKLLDEHHQKVIQHQPKTNDHLMEELSAETQRNDAKKYETTESTDRNLKRPHVDRKPTEVNKDLSLIEFPNPLNRAGPSDTGQHHEEALNESESNTSDPEDEEKDEGGMIHP